MAKAGLLKTLPFVLNVKAFGAFGDGVIGGGGVLTGTDDSAAIQAAIDAAAVLRCTVFFPPGIYLHNTPLNLQGKNGIALKGASGGIPWVFSPISEPMGSTIVYMGTGTTPAWNCTSLIGALFQDLAICYYSTSFTGKMMHFTISGQHPASSCKFLHCRFQSWADDGSQVSAACLVSLQFAISITFTECYLYGAQWLARGVETTGAIGEASNSITFRSCVMQGGAQGFFANPTDGWLIEDCALEAFPIPGFGPPLCIMGGDVDGIVCIFRYIGNWHWDENDDVTVPIQQPAGQNWDCTFRENVFDGSFQNPSKHMVFLGTGNIRIENTTFKGTLDGQIGPTLIDLGNSATALKSLVRIVGNSWFNNSSTPLSTIISNQSGHQNVLIENNSTAA